MQPPTGPGIRNATGPPQPRRRRRRAARLLALLMALLAGCCIFLVSRPGKALVLDYVAGSLRNRLGVEARAAGLDYRLLARGVTLSGVTVELPGATQPLFRAERVDIDFAPGILFGTLALKRLDVIRPDVVLDATTQATPAGISTGTTAADSIPSFDIGRMDLHDLGLTVGRVPGTQVSIRGLSLALVGEGAGRLRGTLVVLGGLSVQHPHASIHLDRAHADVSFAGTSLSIASMSAESPVATVNAAGRVDVSGGKLDARYEVLANLGEVHQWWTNAPPVRGGVNVSGVLGGTLEKPVATFTARGDHLRWKDLSDIRASASASWSGGDLVVDPYEVSTSVGTARAHGRAQVAVVAGRPSALRLEAEVRESRRLALLIGAPAVPAVPVSLSADLAWAGPVPGASTLGGSLHVAALDSDSSAPPLASLQARGKGGRWTLEQHGALAGETTTAAEVTITVDPATLSLSTLGGRMRVRSADVTAALRDLRRRGFSWADVADRITHGRATAEATLTGTLARPRVELSVSADSFSIAGIDRAHGEALIHVDGPSVDVVRMTAEASGNRVDMHGAVALKTSTIDLVFDGRLPRPEMLAAQLPAQWRPTGSLAFSGRLKGPLRDPQLAGRISGSGVEANGVVVDTLDGGVTFERGLLHVSDLRLDSGAGSLRLGGDIDTRLEQMAIHARGVNLALSLRQPGVEVENLSVDAEVAGALKRPSGTMSVAAGSLTVEGRALGPLTMSAEATDGTVHFDLESPAHRAEVTGSVGLEHAWPYEAHANLRQSSLDALLAVLGPKAASLESTGAITVSADIAGSLDRPFDSSAVISVTQLDGQVQGTPLRLVQPGRVRVDGLRATVEEPIRMSLGGLAVGLASLSDQRNGDGIRATIDGRIEDGLVLMPPGASRTAWLADGPVHVEVSVTHEGDRVAIAADADATLSRLRRAGQELARDLAMRARVREGAIEISKAEGTVLGGPFAGSGSVPLSWVLPAWLVGAAPARDQKAPPEAIFSARADVTVARTLEALAVARDDVSGSAKIAVEARATAPRLDAVDATLKMDSGELVVSDVSVAQQGPTTFRFNGGRLEVEELSWKGPRSVLAASGALGILPGTEGELQAEGKSALSFLSRIAPGTAGDAAFRIRVSGPPGARRTAGNITLNDTSLIDPKRQLALAGLSGTLTLDADVLETRDLRGQLNGGELTIDGAIPIRPGVVPARPLKVQGRGLFVEIPKGLRSQLDTTLTWENTAPGPRLSGQVSISSDIYRQPITAIADLAASLSGASPAQVLTLPPWVAATALDIRLNSVGPIVVDQSVLKVELVPDVRLAGTVGRPSLSGQIAIQDDGRIQAGGRTYRLTDSRLEFAPASGLLPRLNVMGETRVSLYLVTLRMTGPANDIETNLSSDPPLSERDVRSLLVTGQTSDPAGRNSEAERFAIGAVSGDVLGIAGQFVGLDSVRVGTEDLDLVSSDVNPATRLTVSKRLGTKFELVLSQNLEDNESTWIVIYRPVAGYEFRLSSEENTTEGLEFRQEITFGPGVSSHGRARSVAVVPEKVRAVTLAGEPGFPADLVLAGTKIRAGDRFDFRQWLSDRDRIARFYMDRGYLTARVVPLRAAGESTEKERIVDLQYRVTRGRRTLLEVTGYTANDEFIGQLRQAWSENVLFQLLNESLARVARDHLIDSGFLRAHVRVEVDWPQADTERARVDIEPGPRTDSRRLAFRGNQVIPSETLQQLATSRQLDDAAWKDPAPLLREIQAAYAAKGHLAARATADPIEFSDEAATLPIRIEEGPPAHVASLRLTGVSPEREPAALEAVALPIGAPFASGMGRAGRARLERHYRERGYRDVRVDVSSTAVQGGPDVALAFAVNEGPLHVVRSVDIAGIQSTRPSLVSNAIRLVPGSPAGTAAAAETERRLYQLGTFRRAEVRFELDPASASTTPGTVPVNAIVSVEEARRFQLRYGVELSSEYSSTLSQRTNSLGVAADLRDRNFLGRGLSLGGGLRYEPDLRSARSLFSVPRLAGLPLRTNVYLTARGEEDETDQQVAVRDDEVELSIEQRWRVGRSVEYLVELQRRLAGYAVDVRDPRGPAVVQWNAGIPEWRDRHRSTRQLLRRETGMVRVGEHAVGTTGVRLRCRLPAHAGPRVLLPAGRAGRARRQRALGAVEWLLAACRR